MGTLEGICAVVTAAAGGAGRVIAERLADVGARVLACDIDGAAVDRFATARPDILARTADVGDEAAVDRIFAEALERFGRLDLLVNNVGIAGPTAAAEDVSLADWEQSARTGLPLRLPYVVSKAGVLSLTTNLARELGPFGIRVNAILPGAIAGDRLRRVVATKAEALGVPAADYERQLLRYVSMRTMVEPDDIAAMVVFLAGPGGRRVTGQLIAVDGNVEYEE